MGCPNRLNSDYVGIVYGQVIEVVDYVSKGMIFGQIEVHPSESGISLDGGPSLGARFIVTFPYHSVIGD